jgi:hypothetical protein
VAEIAFDPIAINTGTAPFNFDKLALRRISWISEASSLSARPATSARQCNAASMSSLNSTVWAAAILTVFIAGQVSSKLTTSSRLTTVKSCERTPPVQQRQCMAPLGRAELTSEVSLT